jgi:hypothetical protein
MQGDPSHALDLATVFTSASTHSPAAAAQGEWETEQQ